MGELQLLVMLYITNVYSFTLFVCCIDNGESSLAGDVLLGRPAGMAVGSHAMAAGAHQSAMLPQSLLMAQHPAAQQLMLARHDPSSVLSSHAGLVGHHGLTSASGLTMLPGLTGQQGLPGLHDYMHGLVGQQQAVARGELQPRLSQAELSAATGGLQQHQQGGQLSGWSTDQFSQQSAQQDPAADRLHRYITSHYLS